MDTTSEALLALKPVSFATKRQVDPAGTSQFGLVAEDVDKVDPDLVIRDKMEALQRPLGSGESRAAQLISKRA